jgi:hypothetical protein
MKFAQSAEKAKDFINAGEYLTAKFKTLPHLLP